VREAGGDAAVPGDASRWIAARQERHRHNGGMSELRVLDAPSEAAEGSRGWGGSRVAAGHLVATDYVPIHDVVIHSGGGRHLSPAAVERAYAQQLDLGSDQCWPPPTGYWREDGRFVLTDGRNRYVAALMLGVEYLLVAWLVAPPE
jgi:hypothetical protein